MVVIIHAETLQRKTGRHTQRNTETERETGRHTEREERSSEKQHFAVYSTLFYRQPGQMTSNRGRWLLFEAIHPGIYEGKSTNNYANELRNCRWRVRTPYLI